MEDKDLIQLYFDRAEDAISKTEEIYGKYCRKIAFNILASLEDSAEVFNDALLRTWNSIPPAKPDNFKAYIGRITRNLALDQYDKQHAAKRGLGQTDAVLDEISEIIGKGDVAEDIICQETEGLINEFLKGLDPDKRKIFVRRYWYLDSIADIAKMYDYTQSKVKVSLMRTRNQLAEYLKKEGVNL